jgi:hypothetical protein
MERLGPLLADPWNFDGPFKLVPMNCINGHVGQGSPIDETRTADFNFRSRLAYGQNSVADPRGAVSAGRSRTIAGPGCRRQRDSSGAGECARAQRLGQRSQRHRQCGQSTGVTVADHNAGHAAQRVLFRRLPVVADAARGQAQTTAIGGLAISSQRAPGGGQRARQADRPQGLEHLQGMLNSVSALECWIACLRQGY